MIRVTNNKNIAITFDNMILPPLANISMSEQDWGKLYSNKAIRESVSLGYITAETITSSRKKSNNKETE